MMNKPINALSLFASSGIGEFYLNDIGIEVKVANELLPKRASIYRDLYPKSNMICGDITDEEIYNKVINSSQVQNCNLVIATPPCQGMSVAGKMDQNDPRNKLIIFVVKSILDLNVDFALIENVPGMLKFVIKVNGKWIKITDYIKQKLQPKYNITFDILNAADFGTPQNRKRAFILISKKDIQLNWKIPDKEKQITVKETIGYLPSLESGQISNIKYHFAKKHKDTHILWMQNTPTGQTALNNKVFYPSINGRKIRAFLTTYKRISWDKPSPTITMCNGAISSQNNVHPGRKNKDGTYSDARVLSLLELFLLMGLPPDPGFSKNTSENQIRHVLGEAVPPILLKKILNQIF
ncbi:MAG: DNA (cytosine-5-)-methyltransferase [Flavobacteriales bacterium]|nr:DNA (cytosine-5-)-methyltransferase [Flavobacteriales bacterium]